MDETGIIIFRRSFYLSILTNTINQVTTYMYHEISNQLDHFL